MKDTSQDIAILEDHIRSLSPENQTTMCWHFVAYAIVGRRTEIILHFSSKLGNKINAFLYPGADIDFSNGLPCMDRLAVLRTTETPRFFSLYKSFALVKEPLTLLNLADIANNDEAKEILKHNGADENARPPFVQCHFENCLSRFAT